MSHKSHNWANAIKAIFSPVRKRRSSASTTLRVESLDERIVPAKLFAADVTKADGAAGSLRDVITTASAFDDGDITIVLSAGVYKLTLAGAAQENANAKGDLDIFNTVGTFTAAAPKKITLQGAGSGATTIDASTLGGTDRVVQILGKDVEVHFSNLTMTGGKARDDGTDGKAPDVTDAKGGGVLNFDGANVFFTGAVAKTNVAFGAAGTAGVGAKTTGTGANANGKAGANGKNAFGGGLYSVGGTVTITGGSSFSANLVLAGDGGAGGAGNTKATTAKKIGSGGGGGIGGNAFGGGIYADAGTIVINGASILTANKASGGTGGKGGVGSVDQVSSATKAGGGGGAGGAAGNAGGGGIYMTNGAVSVQAGANVTANQVNGTAGDGAGGVGGAGGAAKKLGNGGFGGAGGAGGTTVGGGVAVVTGNVTVDTGGKVIGNIINGVAGNGGGGAGGVGGAVGTGTAKPGAGGSAGAGGAGGTSFGGGIYSGKGTVVISGGTIDANLVNNKGTGVALGGGGGAGAAGGKAGKTGGGGGNGSKGGVGAAAGGAGIYAVAGDVTVSAGSSVSSNKGFSGLGGDGGKGGAVGTGATNAGGGGNGGAGGAGGSDFFGGGVYAKAGNVAIDGASTVSKNNAFASEGGDGGAGATGGAKAGRGGAGGAGGGSGTAAGGGVYATAGNVTVLAGSSVNTNLAIVVASAKGDGGAGGKAGKSGTGGNGGVAGASAKAGGGGIFAAAGNVTVDTGSTIGGNFAIGGTGQIGGAGGAETAATKAGVGIGGLGQNGSNGGAGAGGGIAVSAGDITIQGASTITGNAAFGGTGGAGGAGGAAKLGVAGNGGTAGNGGVAHGGGIWSAKSTVLIQGTSTLSANVAVGGSGGAGAAGGKGAKADGAGGSGGAGGEGEGGGLWVQDGAVTVSGSSLVNAANAAVGGPGGAGASRGSAGAGTAVNGNGGAGGLAHGGGLWTGAAPLTVSGRVLLQGNTATGGAGGAAAAGKAGGKAGNGGNGGDGVGGGLISETGDVTVALSIVRANKATGGVGGLGGAVGLAPGSGGAGGLAHGGGIAIGTGSLSVTDTDVGGTSGAAKAAAPNVFVPAPSGTGNTVTGGAGGKAGGAAGTAGNGGGSQGGGLYAGTTSKGVTVLNSSFFNNIAAPGGAAGAVGTGGTGGDSSGGGLYSAATTTSITNTTISTNQVAAGGAGTIPGKSLGAGAYVTGTATIHNSTVVSNQTLSGTTQGGGLRNDGTLNLTSSIVIQNGLYSAAGVFIAGTAKDISSIGTVTGDNNLIEDSTGFTITGTSNIIAPSTPVLNPAFSGGGNSPAGPGTPGNTVYVLTPSVAALNGTSSHRLVTLAEFPGSDLIINSKLPPGATTANDLGANPDGLLIDQIGNKRVQGVAPDIGAVEGGVVDTSGANVTSGVFGSSTGSGTSFDQVVLTFNEAIDPTTFTTSDILTLTAPDGSAITASKITADASKTIFTVSFPTQSATGDYSITLGVNILDAALNQMNQNKNAINGEVPEDQFSGTGNLPATGSLPAITTAAFSGLTPNTFDKITVTFNQDIDAATFDATDVTLTAPDGSAITVTGVTPVAGSTTQFDVAFDSQTVEGDYTVVIGPDISNAAGTSIMDQNANNVPGEPGVAPAGDQFQTTGTVLPPSAKGATVTSATFSGAAAKTFDTVTITFDAANPIDVTSIDPATDIVLTGPDGKAIAVTDVTAGAAGTNSVVVTFASQTAAGNYTITVGPDILDAFGNQMNQNDNDVNGEAGVAPTGDAFQSAAGIAQAAIFAVGGSDGGVRIVDAATGNTIINDFRPFDTTTTTYTGIVSVALADLNGDGLADLFVAPASPQGQDGLALTTTATQVLVYDGALLAAGTTPTTTIATFTPFAKSDSADQDDPDSGVTADSPYINGLNIDAGDINGDGTPDLVAGSRGGSAGFGLREHGRVTVISGVDQTTVIGGASVFPFSESYEKGVVLAAVDLDGTAVPGEQIAVTRGGPVAETNPNKDNRLKVLTLTGGTLTDLNVNQAGVPAPGSPAFAPFAGITRDARVTGVDSNGDGTDELVFSALDRTDPANTQVRVIVYGVDLTNGNLTTLSQAADASAGSYLIGTGVVDHAISHNDTNGDGIDDLAIALEDATPNIGLFAPLTGADAGGFNLSILTGGVTLDGI